MKRIRRALYIIFSAAALLLNGAILSAQTPSSPAPESREDLFFTYAGIAAAGGYSTFTRNGWIDGKEDTKKSSAVYAAPGLLIDVYVRNICGEFSWQYYVNIGSDKAVAFSHSFYTATAKYCYELTPLWMLTSGGGFYFEGAPSQKAHNGAGGELSAGTVLSLHGKFDVKLTLDGRFRYGFYGQDAKSYRMGYGIVFGITTKLGRS